MVSKGHRRHESQGSCHPQPLSGTAVSPECSVDGGITESMKIYRAKVETGDQAPGRWGKGLGQRTGAKATTNCSSRMRW